MNCCWFCFNTRGINGGTAVAVGQTKIPMEHGEVQGRRRAADTDDQCQPRFPAEALSPSHVCSLLADFALQHMEYVSPI